MAVLFEENFDVRDPVEVHWSSSTILAIFFAASLVSAVFFGLGYSFGGASTSKHSLTFNTAPATTSVATPPVQPVKPTPLTASNQPSPISNIAAAHPVTTTPSAPLAALHPVALTPAHLETPVIEKKSVPPPPVKLAKETASSRSNAHIMVQVGAIGNRKDAERLVVELRKKGFHAGIYAAKNDKFLHVQIGPFNDAAQAQSKRHQVMASGFHAILKTT
ncbi:MAG: SPOR domain-containing protein [Acidobacteriota bacterium]